MKRFSPRSLIILGLSLVILVSVPKSAADRVRAFFLPLSLPVWELCGVGKQVLCAGPCASGGSQVADSLRIENDALRDQIERIFCWLKQQDHLEFLATQDSCDLQSVIDQSKQYVSAKVIFREPASWSQFIWIDVGENVNRERGVNIVEKNSPVIADSALIGVVEKCYNNRSLVRLITDSQCAPSVRAARGLIQTRVIKEYLDPLLHQLPLQKEIFADGEEYESVIDSLKLLNMRLESSNADRLFAKGQLQGLSEPLWRCRNQKLRGFGFQWDRADEEGPAREARYGYALDTKMEYGPIDLLKIGDILVTSGLDGVFPPNLKVATVTKVFPLGRGEPTYEIEADILAPNINDLSYVHVIPPLRLD